MNTSHKNILIPISRTLNKEKAVAEAIKFAKPWQTTIHLVRLLMANPARIDPVNTT